MLPRFLFEETGDILQALPRMCQAIWKNYAFAGSGISYFLLRFLICLIHNRLSRNPSSIITAPLR